MAPITIAAPLASLFPATRRNPSVRLQLLRGAKTSVSYTIKETTAFPASRSWSQIASAISYPMPSSWGWRSDSQAGQLRDFDNDEQCRGAK